MSATNKPLVLKEGKITEKVSLFNDPVRLGFWNCHFTIKVGNTNVNLHLGGQDAPNFKLACTIGAAEEMLAMLKSIDANGCVPIQIVDLIAQAEGNL